MGPLLLARRPGRRLFLHGWRRRPAYAGDGFGRAPQHTRDAHRRLSDRAAVRPLSIDPLYAKAAQNHDACVSDADLAPVDALHWVVPAPWNSDDPPDIHRLRDESIPSRHSCTHPSRIWCPACPRRAAPSTGGAHTWQHSIRAMPSSFGPCVSPTSHGPTHGPSFALGALVD